MKQSKGIIYVLMAAVLFSIGGLCIKLIPWSPLAINGARNLISAVIIGILMATVIMWFISYVLLGGVAILG